MKKNITDLDYVLPVRSVPTEAKLNVTQKEVPTHGFSQTILEGFCLAPNKSDTPS